MTNFKSLRLRSGLTPNQAAKLLCMDLVSIYRFEMNPDKKTARKPPELALKVLEWWIDGKAPCI
ncbi:MAG: helix-turn-helix domain-containing protein [Colwellia sp.]|nr:helix-turn-helix domain-containing protein [Colwellia sp.]